MKLTLWQMERQVDGKWYIVPVLFTSKNAARRWINGRKEFRAVEVAR